MNTIKRSLTPTCLSIKQLAPRLGVSDRTVRRWLATGQIRYHRLGSAIRITEEDIAAFLAARRR